VAQKTTFITHAKYHLVPHRQSGSITQRVEVPIFLNLFSLNNMEDDVV